jgi:dihydroxyacetone kinase-like predicted kinase
MAAEDLEIVTLYYGNGIPRAEAEALGAVIHTKYSNLEVEIVEGGQPHYYYIISAE